MPSSVAVHDCAAKGWKRWVPELVVLAVAIAMLAYGPIHQPADYHRFADARMLLGIPKAADVLSSFGFLLVALWGALEWRNSPPRDAIRPGFALFLIALALAAAGSGYYHLAPDNTRLVWDRLPIALACAGLLTAAHAETQPQRHPRALPEALTLVGVASVARPWTRGR